MGRISNNQINEILANQARPCSRCRVVKPFSAFRKSKALIFGASSRCKDCLNEKARLNKQAVIEAYSGRCACCEVSHPEFLAVDHIFNDGASHKREAKLHDTKKFYQWLLNNGCPKDRFQLLCHNCNSAKALYGECPHVREVIPFPVAC